jgi:hypothetical protein
MLMRRDWRGLSGMAVGALLLFLIGAAGDVQWVGKFVQTSQQKFGLAFGSQPTLYSMAALLCANESACTLWTGSLFSLALAAPVIYIVLRKSRELSALQVFSLAAPLGMLVTPYLWSYDHVLLIIAFVWLAYQLIRRTEKYTFAMLFLIAVDVAAGYGLYLRGLRPEKDFWSLGVPLAVLILVMWFVLLPSLVMKTEPLFATAEPARADIS